MIRAPRMARPTIPPNTPPATAPVLIAPEVAGAEDSVALGTALLELITVGRKFFVSRPPPPVVGAPWNCVGAVVGVVWVTRIAVEELEEIKFELVEDELEVADVDEVPTVVLV